MGSGHDLDREKSCSLSLRLIDILKDNVMMKRLLMAAAVAALTVPCMVSNPVSADKAMEIALQFTRHNQVKSFTGASDNALRLNYVSRNAKGDIDYYVIDREHDGGFIIVAGDDVSTPVWGYSEHGVFDYDQLPDNMQWWLSEYQSQLQWLRDHPEAQTRQSVVLTSAVQPLIQTRWDQIQPFNNYCPIAFGGPNGRAYAGCLATALAQIMKYYQHPQHGYGSHTYSFYLNNRLLTLSADFSQSVYQWSQMLNDYTSSYSSAQGNAVARLVSDAGIALNMAYGANGSIAYYKDVVEPLVAYFDYSPSTTYWLKARYEGDWDALLRSELDARRPIYYFGQKGEEPNSSGHAFVVDGYNESGLFHINWGWGGDLDGYFVSGLFNPNGGTSSTAGYNSKQGAIIKIEPDQTGTGGITLKSGIRAFAEEMPASDVRASITLECLNGPYSGTLRLAVATKTGDNSYRWNQMFRQPVSLEAGETKVIDFKGSFDLTVGETYYFVLLNPYITTGNYLWTDAVPFTVISPDIPGDVNNDKEVTVADVNAVISLIIGGTTANASRADVNGDGEINLADVNAIISIILK